MAQKGERLVEVIPSYVRIQEFTFNVLLKYPRHSHAVEIHV